MARFLCARSVVLLAAAAAILCGVVVVAMGRGGEMAVPPSATCRPTLGDLVTAADVALLRPPAALWGYDMRGHR